MYKFSIGEAWRRTMELFRAYGWQAAIIMLVSYAIIIGLIMLIGVSVAGAATLTAYFDSLDNIAEGNYIFFLIIAFIIGGLFFIPFFSIWRLSLSQSNEKIGGALAYGLLACAPAVAVTVLIWIVLFAGVFAILLPFGLSGYFDGGVSSALAAGIGVLILFLGFLVLLLFLVARLCLCGPVMAVRKSYNPFAGFAESWKITRGNSLMLMVYVFLLNLVFYIIASLGGIFSDAAPIVSGIVTLIVNLGLSILYAFLPVGIYNSMVGDGALQRETVERIFE